MVIVVNFVFLMLSGLLFYFRSIVKCLSIELWFLFWPIKQGIKLLDRLCLYILWCFYLHYCDLMINWSLFLNKYQKRYKNTKSNTQHYKKGFL